jgi:HK97 family phage portal protein
MKIRSAIKNFALKAISYLGWNTSEGPIGGWLTNGNTSADRNKYANEIGNPLNTPMIMAAVVWLMRTIYEAPLFIVTRDDAGKEKKRTYKHHVLKLLKNPNEFYNGMVMMKGIAASWDLNGNAYILKWRDPNTLRVEALYYEPHYSIRPRYWNDGVYSTNKVERDGKFISFYEIYRPDDRGSSNVWKRIEVDDVIHLKDGMDPFNQRLGINKLASLLAEIYTDLQRAHFSATVLSNIGMIPFVLSPRESGQVITQAQATKLKEELELRSQSERGKAIVAGRAIRIDELGFSPADMDLSAMASIPEERVAAVIGPNSYVLGFIPENSQYTNFLEARRDAYESFLIPLQSYIAAQLTEDLLREFIDDEFANLEYDYSGVYAMTEWRVKIFDMWGKAFRDGIARRSDARSAVGLKVEKEDDGYYEDFNKKEETLPNPGNPGPNGSQPGKELIDDGNERLSQREDKGPVAGGKKK